MSDYSNNIKKFKDELNNFINKYDIDDADSYNKPFFTFLKRNTHKLIDNSNNYINTLTKQIKRFDYTFNKILKDNSLKITEINEKLKNDISKIKDTYLTKIKDINEEIEDLKVKTQYSIDTYKQDIEFFINSSVQKEEIIDDEYNESVNKFDYQLTQAKDSYNQNINRYNDILNSKLKEHELEFEKVLKNFELQHIELAKKFEGKIEQTEKILNEIMIQFKAYQTHGKETSRKESIALNEAIKVLSEKKNKDIVEAKETYSKALASSAIEKENKKTIYNQDNQKIQKDFVYNINYLDDILNDIKETYNKNIEEEQRNLFYNLYEITTKQNAELNKIIKNYSSDDLPKYTKNAIKSKNKQYYKMQLAEREISKRNMDNLARDYFDDIENAKHNKSLLEIDRIHSIKTLTEKEQSDNKYYQQLNIIHENDMNLLIQLANLKFNQRANAVKFKSRINSINNEKNYDIGEANFQKQIEAIKTKIEKYKLELQSTISLREIITSYESNKYAKEKHYQSVSTLLEIEKYKVLNEFNTRRHYHNITNTKMLCDYNKRKIQIQNERFDAESNVNIQISNALLQRGIVDANLKIKQLKYYEEQDIAIATRNFNNEIESRNQNVLYERFKFEIRSIHQTLSTFVLLNKDVIDFTKKVMAELFRTNTIDDESKNITLQFIKDFSKIIQNYYFSLISQFLFEENDFVSNRIKFEEEFKFKAYYDNLKNKHDDNINNLLLKEKSIQDTIENYSNTIDIFKNRIYNLESQIILLNERLGSKLVNDKDELKTKISNNILDITDFKRKINDITKLKDILNKDLININIEIKKAENQYSKNLGILENMQYNSAMTYHKLKDSLEKYINAAIPKATAIFKNELNFIEISDIEPYIYEKYVSFSEINESIVASLYGIVDHFFTSTVSAINNNTSFLNMTYKSDINDINKKYNDLIEDTRIDFQKILNVHDNEIKALQRKINNTTKRYNNMLKENDRIYNDNIEAILNEQKNSEKQFYTDYYATCENLDAITNEYKEFMRNLNVQFENKKSALVENTTKMRNDFNSNLSEFIKAKNNLIERLPQAAKYNKIQINKQTKEINQQLDGTIKETKLKFNTEKKSIQRNISNIQNTLNYNLNKLNIEHQKNIIKEKKKRDAEKQKASSNS